MAIHAVKVEDFHSNTNISNIMHMAVKLQEKFSLMGTEESKEYLSIVVDMEKNIYMQNSIITELENEIDILGLKKQFNKPKGYDAYEWIFILPMLLFGLGFIGLGVLACFKGKKFFTGEVDLFNWLIALFLFLFGLCSIISGFIFICEILRELASSYKTKKKAKQEELKYKKDRLIDQKRVKRELIRKKILIADLQQIRAQNSESKRILEKIYAQNIIFPK